LGSAVEADLRFAHELADAADAVTLAHFRSLDLRVDTKPDLTPVSEADRAAEDAVRSVIAASGRGEGVLGEETGQAGADDGGTARWIVDPIDGTRSYVRGLPVWATLLALERDGVVDVGLVSAPALGRRWWAVRGDGAWTDGSRCRVSDVGRFEDAVVSTTSPRDMPAGWYALTRRAWADRGFSDFWQYCLVAEGSIDVAAEEALQLWDYAAVELIVSEAGGRCTTFTGTAPSPGAPFLASNGRLHDEAVAALRRQTA
jgi:histidinol-phosphatase